MKIFGIILYTVLWLVLIASGIHPYDRQTWVMEVFWVFGGLILFAVLYFKNIKLTPLVGILLFIHALILIYGGHYTYEKVPLGFWMQEWFGFVRNNYDRIGHFAQGFIPAILFREIFARNKVINGRRWWLTIVVFASCVAFSALFELLEFASAMALGSGADNYLGSQGDIWDAQWDMLYCAIGSVISLVVFSNLHDKQLSQKS
jgi:putative membrane protein